MSWEQRNHDFSNAQVEAMMAYIEAEREIKQLQAENAKLREHVKMPDEPLEIDEKDFYVRAFIKWAIEEQPEVERLEAENEQLRELVRKVEHYERFGCQGCPHSGSCGAGTLYDEDCAMSREIERGKRELGVDV